MLQLTAIHNLPTSLLTADLSFPPKTSLFGNPQHLAPNHKLYGTYLDLIKHTGDQSLLFLILGSLPSLPLLSSSKTLAFIHPAYTATFFKPCYFFYLPLIYPFIYHQFFENTFFYY